MKAFDMVLKDKGHTRTCALNNLAPDSNHQTLNRHPFDVRRRWRRKQGRERLFMLAVHDSIIVGDPFECKHKMLSSDNSRGLADGGWVL